MVHVPGVAEAMIARRTSTGRTRAAGVPRIRDRDGLRAVSADKKQWMGQ